MLIDRHSWRLQKMMKNSLKCRAKPFETSCRQETSAEFLLNEATFNKLKIQNATQR